MNDNPVSNATIAFQLDELPVIIPRAIVRKLTHPYGTAGVGSRGDIPLGVMWWVLGEDVSEEGFHDRHAAAYETGVDFDHTVKRTSVSIIRGQDTEGQKYPYVKRKVLASNQGASGEFRFTTKRENRTVVTTQLLRGQSPPADFWTSIVSHT